MRFGTLSALTKTDALLKFYSPNLNPILDPNANPNFSVSPNPSTKPNPNPLGFDFIPLARKVPQALLKHFQGGIEHS